MRQHLRKAALVTLKTGETFRGVLFDADRDCLVLRNCQVLEVGGDRVPQPVDGEVLILRTDVSFVQFV